MSFIFLLSNGKKNVLIIHKCIKIFDNNIVPLPSSSINNKSTYFSSHHFLIHRLDVFPYFHNQKQLMLMEFFFFNFMNVSNFYWKFYVFKIKSFCKIFISFCNSSWVTICKGVCIWLNTIENIHYHQYFEY